MSTSEQLDESFLNVIDAAIELHNKRATIFAINAFSRHICKKGFNVQLARSLCGLNPKEYLLNWEVRDEIPSGLGEEMGIIESGGIKFVLEIKARGKKDARIKKAKENLSKAATEAIDLPMLPVLGGHFTSDSTATTNKDVEAAKRVKMNDQDSTDKEPHQRAPSQLVSPAVLTTTTAKNNDITKQKVASTKLANESILVPSARQALEDDCNSNVVSTMVQTSIKSAKDECNQSASPAKIKTKSGIVLDKFDPEAALSKLKQEKFYEDQCCFERRLNARPGSFIPMEEIDFLSNRVKDALVSQWKVSSLYRHQVDAIKASLDDKHVLLLTGTGSGKTLCFASVVAERLARIRGLDVDAGSGGGGFLLTQPRKPRSIFLYPTKALAQDQLRALKSLFERESVNICAIDGDSTPSERQFARENADVLLTNPDFMHCTILPRAHGEWRQFVNSIELVVIDEAHTYNGAFGCHFAFVLRRLMRLVDQFPPCIFMCSATIGNPMETFERLTGLNVSLATTVNNNQESVDDNEEVSLVKRFMNGGESLNGPSLLSGRDHVVAGTLSFKASSSSSSSSSATSSSATSSQNHFNDLRNTTVQSSSSSSLAINKVVASDEQQQQEEEEGLSNESNVSSSSTSSQQELRIIDKDASPQGSRLVVLWRPKVLKVLPDGREKRASAIFETARVFTSLIRMGVRTLAFCKTRKLVELVLKYTYDLLSGENKQMNEEDVDAELIHSSSSSIVLDTTSGGFHHSSFTFDDANETDDLSKSSSTTTTTTTTTTTQSKSSNKAKVAATTTSKSSTSSQMEEKLKEKVLAYRAGYTKQERRDIERRMFSGELLGICCTSALELGIDIGTCDCVVVLGVTGASSTMQMFGRAGRKGRNALNICVTFDGALDRCLLRQPESFLERRAEESAVFDVRNEVIMKKHLLCAAKENPLDFVMVDSSDHQELDSTVFDRELSISFCKSMVEDDLLVEESPMRFRIKDKVSKPHDFSIRVVDGMTIRLMDDQTKQTLDEIEYVRAFFELYPGAIYLHQSRTYCVTFVDLTINKEARAKRVQVDYYTSPMDDLHIKVLKVFETKTERECAVTGVVRLTRTLTGFRKLRFNLEDVWAEMKHRKLNEKERFNVYLPPIEYSTRATWVDLGSCDECWDRSEQKEEYLWGCGIHAVQHLMLKAMRSLILTHFSSIETTHRARAIPNRLILFDRDPGGIGIAEAVFTRIHDCLNVANAILESCKCTSGCEDCIFETTCFEFNMDCDKVYARKVLDRALEMVGSKEEQGEIVRNKSRFTTPRKLRRAKHMAKARADGSSMVPMWKRHLPELGSEHVQFDSEL